MLHTENELQRWLGSFGLRNKLPDLETRAPLLESLPILLSGVVEQNGQYQALAEIHPYLGRAFSELLEHNFEGQNEWHRGPFMTQLLSTEHHSRLRDWFAELALPEYMRHSSTQLKAIRMAEHLFGKQHTHKHVTGQVGAPLLEQVLKLIDDGSVECKNAAVVAASAIMKAQMASEARDPSLVLHAPNPLTLFCKRVSTTLTIGVMRVLKQDPPPELRSLSNQLQAERPNIAGNLIGTRGGQTLRSQLQDRLQKQQSPPVSVEPLDSQLSALERFLQVPVEVMKHFCNLEYEQAFHLLSRKLEGTSLDPNVAATFMEAWENRYPVN